MPVTLTERQVAKVAAALRRGAIDSFRIADAIDPAGRSHFLIEVSDMGQFANDWNQLKTIIRQKDDAIDQQSAQIAALQKQLAGQQQLDADDQKAIVELRQTVGQNASSVGTAAHPAVASPRPVAPAATTHVSAPAAVSPHSPAVTTFVK